MYTEDELCRQLKYILPDVGECGIDISVKRDEKKNKWLVRLKKNDKAVWDDLWQNEEDPYRISIDFLHHFLKHGNGFPICDLIDEDNYWFCVRHIKPKGMELMQDIGDKVKNDKPLSFAEAFLLEVFRGSTDLWHFCYRYNVPVKTGKSRIDDMNHDDLLVHLPERDDLVKYLDI